MASRNLFGSLKLDGTVGRGENPNGFVSQTSNGTNMNGMGSDGDDWTWGTPASGPRWNKTEPDRKLADTAVRRPVSIVASRR